MAKTRIQLPKIPSSAKLVDRHEAAKILTEQTGEGFSYSSLTRLLENDWAQYEGYIWCDRSSKHARNRKVKIWIEGVMNWLSLPSHLR
jgi:hypothetical protein